MPGLQANRDSAMAHEPFRRITLVGFGEAGGILGHDLAKQGIEVSFFDILLHSKKARPAMLAKAQASGAHAKETLRDAIHNVELIISAVTASSAPSVAKEAAPLLRPGQFFLDINSVSPETKRGESRRFEKSTGHFVEAAVMAPVPPQRIKVPMLLGGKRAAELAPRLQTIGMNATAVSDQIGVASAIKMCRSVMIKGLEALAIESLFAARRYGAEDAVLASLEATFPSMGWKAKLPDCLIGRVAEHGRRRAAEMREAALAVADVGLDPLLTERTAKRHDWLIDEIAAQGVSFDAGEFGESFSWRALADALASGKKRRAARPKRRSSL
jgi:3-hydroxyisobutyrate dehydrogenase-like beta-hydroxyacid dehydrogenase